MILTEHFRQNPLLIIAIILMSLLMLASPDTQALLEYQRQAILNGELWRLLSGHLTHINQPHLLLNIGGLSLVWIMGSSHLTLRDWLISTLFIALFISCALLLLDPEIEWYRGFSGVLHGLFVYVASKYLKTRPYFAILLITALLGKIVYESFSGQMPWYGDHTDFAIITQAHVYGGVGGLIIAFALCRKTTTA